MKRIDGIYKWVRPNKEYDSLASKFRFARNYDQVYNYKNKHCVIINGYYVSYIGIVAILLEWFQIVAVQEIGETGASWTTGLVGPRG